MITKLSRYSQLTCVQLQSLDSQELSKLNENVKPEDVLDERFLIVEEVPMVDLEFNVDILNNFLIENYENDFECALEIYKTFKRLDRSTLLDSCMWSYYGAQVFWKYTYTRYFKDQLMLINSDELNKLVVLKNTKPSSIFSHSIARNWWIVDITRNTELEDKYQITKYIFSNEFLIELFFKNEFILTKNFVKNFFHALLLTNDEEWDINKEDQEFLEYVLDTMEQIGVYTIFDSYDTSDYMKLITKMYEGYN